jgi:hypothetical protein
MYIHAINGTRTRDPSNLATADLRLRRRLDSHFSHFQILFKPSITSFLLDPYFFLCCSVPQVVKWDEYINYSYFGIFRKFSKNFCGLIWQAVQQEIFIRKNWIAPSVGCRVHSLWGKGKGNAIPLQAWAGPEGSRRLRLPDFKTVGTWRW